MRRVAGVTLGLIALSLAACREAPIEPTAKPAAAPAAVQPAAEPLVELPAPDPALMRMPLQERLGREASARPTDAIRTGQLEQALATRGIKLVRKRQVLASTLGAAYCELSVTDQGVGVSLCEYPDAASAKAGSARSHKMFDSMIPGRTLVAQGNTLLTVTQPASEAADQQAKQILTVFSQEKPSSLPTQTALAH